MKRGFILAAAVAALGLGSCASERAPAELRVAHSPAGPAADGGVLVLDVEGWSVTRLPAALGRPLASRSTLITGATHEPLAASPSPAERVVLVDPGVPVPGPGGSPDFGWVKELAGQRVLIPHGVVAAMSIGPVAQPGAGATPVVELLVRATAADAPPLLTLRAERDASEEEEALGAPAGVPGAAGTGLDRARRIQELRVDWPLDQTEGEFALAVPAAPDRGLTAPTLWRFRARVVAPDDPAVAEAGSLVESVRAAGAPPPAAPWEPMARSLREAQAPGAQRAALAFAAVDTGADLTAESAALAEDAVLAALTAGAAEALERARAGTNAALMGWSLDRATILTLGRLHAESSLARALGSVLSARYGEVGRDPAALADLARRSGSSAEMDTRLEAEHLILLDDASPALRVRSFDWLAARGAAPAGYDPLGPVKERRAAVDQHLQSTEEKP